MSSVDTHVGKHLFENCILGKIILLEYMTRVALPHFYVYINIYYINILIGYLKDKTCVLVTHQIQYLTNVDRIVLTEKVDHNYKH